MSNDENAIRVGGVNVESVGRESNQSHPHRGGSSEVDIKEAI